MRAVGLTPRLPRHPAPLPASNGTERRLEAILAELQALRTAISPEVAAQRPQPAQSEAPHIRLREPRA